MRNRVSAYRDIAIAAATICAALLHLPASRWAAGGLCVLVGVVWIVTERRLTAYAPALTQAAFLMMGVLMVLRFNESRLWISLAGVWSLVSAADLSRLVERFPVDSPLADQRAVVIRRLRHLGLLAAASAVVAGLARVLTLQLRLVAVVFLAVFIVMVVGRTIRSVGRDGSPGNDEQVGR